MVKQREESIWTWRSYACQCGKLWLP